MIEVGEYARTKSGEIGKVTKIIDGMVFINTNQYWSHIAKHSKNIIDLIEVGDYVNGFKILDITEIEDNNKKVFLISRVGFQDICKIWGDENIETILTHEQFEANYYKVERKKDEI